MTIEEKLQQLTDMNDEFSLVGLNKEAARESVLTDAQRAELEAINAEFDPIADELRTRIAALEDEIKAEVKASGTSVKSAGLHAVYSERVTWDAKALDGYAVNVPELFAFRKATPVAQIRIVKAGGAG